MRYWFLTILFSLGLTAVAEADQNDQRLEALFDLLRKAPDPVSAAPIETNIWQLWLTHDNPQAQGLMDAGITQLNSGNLEQAAATFSQLVALTPDYAEAWNKRATVYYLQGKYNDSDADISKTLALEPFHFGALSGRGLVYAAQRKLEQARNAMHAALEVHPNMTAVKANLAELDAFLRNRTI